MNDFLKVGLEAISKSEKIIDKYFNSDVDFSLKTDSTPVTLADTQIEKVITKTIKTYFPDHAFFGEEFSGSNFPKNKYVWVIDPIDGTKSFMRGIPLFATQLALVQDGEIILGISNAPQLNELVYATKGNGAFLNNKPINVSKVNTLAESYVSHGNIKYFDKYSDINKLISLSKKVRGFRGFAEFWSYHLLATGKIDGFIEADTKFWDFAAQVVIVKEAGGIITDMRGQNISHLTTNIVASNKHLHQEYLSYFN